MFMLEEEGRTCKVHPGSWRDFRVQKYAAGRYERHHRQSHRHFVTALQNPRIYLYNGFDLGFVRVFGKFKGG